MNEGLEALERLYIESNRDFGWEREECHKKDKAIIEKELERLGEIDDILNTGGGIWSEGGFVSDKLKTLEIIKKKQVNIQQLMICSSLKEYNKYIFEQYKHCIEDTQELILTQEEFDLLREVLS